MARMSSVNAFGGQRLARVKDGVREWRSPYGLHVGVVRRFRFGASHCSERAPLWLMDIHVYKAQVFSCQHCFILSRSAFPVSSHNQILILLMLRGTAES